MNLKVLKPPFLTVFFIFLFLFIYFRLAGPIPFAINSVQTTKSNVFQVTGDGKATAIPDIAHIYFGVTKQASTISDAQNQTNSAMQTVLSGLKQHGIDEKDVRTTDYSVNPNYDYNSGRSTITGYSVTQTVDVKIKPIDKVNKVLDSLTANGANIVGQVSFGFDDATQKDLEQKARVEAVTNAKEKAQNLANAAGLHLGPIIDVSENGNEAPRPVFMAADSKAIAQPLGQPSQVTPGTNSVNVTITLSYQTY